MVSRDCFEFARSCVKYWVKSLVKSFKNGIVKRVHVPCFGHEIEYHVPQSSLRNWGEIGSEIFFHIACENFHKVCKLIADIGLGVFSRLRAGRQSVSVRTSNPLNLDF